MLKILTFDGGPGPLLHIRVLKRLEARKPGFLHEVDLFAGTSDGGLMSLYLAKALTEGKSSAEAIDGCIKFSDDYSDCFARDKGVPHFLAGLRAFTRGGHFADIVKQHFLYYDPALGETRDMTLGDLNRNVVVTSFDTRDWVPRMYRNFGDSKDKERDLKLPLWEVAASTSSLPMATPIHGGQENRGYLDGVVCSNNPAMSAVTLAAKHLWNLHMQAERLPDPSDDAPVLHGMTVLSLGVVQSYEEALLERAGGLLPTLAMLCSQSRLVRYIAPGGSLGDRLRLLRSPELLAQKYQNARDILEGIGHQNWGWIETLARRPTYLIDLLMHGLNGEVSRQCRRLLGGRRYHRYEPQINLMNVVVNFFFDHGSKARPYLDDVCRRCFGEDTGHPLTADDRENRKSTEKLLDWLDANWLENEPELSAPPA